MAETVPEQQPFTEAAYRDLVSRYPFVVVKPNDEHLYGFMDLQDAEEFLMLEAGWLTGSLKPIAIRHVIRKV